MAEDQVVEQHPRDDGMLMAPSPREHRKEDLLLGGEVVAARAVPVKAQRPDRFVDRRGRRPLETLRDDKSLMVVAREGGERPIPPHQATWVGSAPATRPAPSRPLDGLPVAEELVVLVVAAVAAADL